MAEDSNNSILADRRLQLYGEPKDGSLRSAPKMMFSVYRGSPSILIFPNDPNDQGQGPIRMSLGLPLFEMFVQAVFEVADGEPGINRTIQVRKTQQGQVQIMGNLVVGKDKEGIVYCSIVLDDESRPKKRIPVTPGQQIEIYNENKEALGEGVKSSLYAKAFFKQVLEQVKAIARETYQPLPQQNGEGQGDNGAGDHIPGYEPATAASTSDDDLPL